MTEPHRFYAVKRDGVLHPVTICDTDKAAKERPVLRRPNIATLDNLLEAIDDGDTESYNHEDGLPTERTWVRIVNLARRLEAGR